MPPNVYIDDTPAGSYACCQRADLKSFGWRRTKKSTKSEVVFETSKIALPNKKVGNGLKQKQKADYLDG
jgi:hypothetical protein